MGPLRSFRERCVGGGLVSRFDEYIHRVMEVAGLPIHSEKGEELRAHLSDIASEYEQQGVDAGQAMDLAIQEFGSPETVGRQLKEVTPLHMSQRDWSIVAAAVALSTVGAFFFFHNEEIAWLPAWTIGGVAAVMLRRPMVGALASVVGVFFGRHMYLLTSWLPYLMEPHRPPYYPFWGFGPGPRSMKLMAVALMIGIAAAIYQSGRNRVSFKFTSLVARLALCFGLIASEIELKGNAYVLSLAVAFLFQAGILAVRLRNGVATTKRERLITVVAHFIPFLVVLENNLWEVVVFVATGVMWFVEQARPQRITLDWHRIASGGAHLTPLLVGYGLLWGAAGVLISSLLWYYNKHRSAFVARHALQSALVGIGGVLSQVVLYQIISSEASIRALPAVAVVLSLIRTTFFFLVIWATISASAGHDFRYPFAGFLFGGGKWRRFRHV